MREKPQQRLRIIAIPCSCGLLLITLALPIWAAPPSITSISFPANLEPQATAYGQINYQDPDRDVSYARFDVADGRYYRLTTSAQSQMYFRLNCTPYAQQITLAVTLFDAAGERSEPAEFTFSCGQPPLYDFDSEQSRSLPVSQKVPLNVFILDDGATALAEGATQREGALLGNPRPEVLDILRENVLPRLTGIWDQCAVGFELVGAWVVKPEQIPIAGGSLADQLFRHEDSGVVIYHGPAAGNLLRQATYALLQTAQSEDSRAAQALNVLVVGARILTPWEGSLTDIEGFSENGWPNYALVRWGTARKNVTPKQMISTLAHELGHNLGLPHPEEDSTSEAASDPMNLMKGSGVSPQPRAHILPSQCRMTERTLTEMQMRASNPASSSTPINPPVTQTGVATVRWLNLCPENLCSGKMPLSVGAEGFPDLQSFSFALFEYSRDGEHFVELGVDRSYQDGFRILWDTTKLPNSTYTLRATVTDARGVRASVLAQVTVRNR